MQIIINEFGKYQIELDDGSVKKEMYDQLLSQKFDWSLFRNNDGNLCLIDKNGETTFRNHALYGKISIVSPKISLFAYTNDSTKYQVLDNESGVLTDYYCVVDKMNSPFIFDGDYLIALEVEGSKGEKLFMDASGYVAPEIDANMYLNAFALDLFPLQGIKPQYFLNDDFSNSILVHARENIKNMDVSDEEKLEQAKGIREYIKQARKQARQDKVAASIKGFTDKVKHIAQKIKE